MAKRIIWSKKAKEERREILEYWFKINGNKKYSGKLAKQFGETVRYIASNNYLGRATDENDLRVTVCGNYLLFYEISFLNYKYYLYGMQGVIHKSVKLNDKYFCFSKQKQQKKIKNKIE